MTRLQIYNSALLILGEGSIASLTENREPRRLLDHVWDTGAVNFCLEQAFWKFATRTIRLDYTASVEPDFGYRRAFVKPDDFVRTAAVASDEYFNCPLNQYSDENGYWFADLDTLYIKYVSNDSQYGGDMSLWPQSFCQYLFHYLAFRICKRETQSGVTKAEIKKDMDDLLKEAKSKDAMAGPTAQMPQGTWVSSRTGSNYRNDRGNRGSLIG